MHVRLILIEKNSNIQSDKINHFFENSKKVDFYKFQCIKNAFEYKLMNYFRLFPTKISRSILS